MDTSGSSIEKRSAKVRRYVSEVTDALKTETPAQISARYAEFQSEFPRIFEMILTPNYPKEVLEMMLHHLERIESGSQTQHNASVAVGSVLVDTFVKPQLKHTK